MAVTSQLTTDVRFIGWYIEPDATSRVTADAGWSTSGTVAGDCVPPSTCVLHTACTSNTLFFDNGGSTTCASNAACVTMTIFETIPFGAPSATNWDCRVRGWASYTTLYKTLLEAPTSETTVYSTVIQTPTMSLSDISSPTSSPSPSTTPLAAPDGAESKAWIAGAVLGPLAGIGLCAAAYWLWMRHRNHRNRPMSTKQEAQPQIADTHQAGSQPELVGDHVAPEFMLHSDSARKTPELPG